MSRIPTPATIEAAPAASQPLLAGRQEAARRRPEPVPPRRQQPRRAGGLPRPVRRARQGRRCPRRPASALRCRGRDQRLRLLPVRAHLPGPATVAKLDDAEMTANRSGASNDPKADAAVRFAAKVTTLRGHVSDDDFGRQGSRLHGRADHRDRPARRAEHLDQLHQHRGPDRDRLSGRHGPQGSLRPWDTVSLNWRSRRTFAQCRSAGQPRPLRTNGRRRAVQR